MNNDTYLLLATAASIGFLHTLFGPDHFIPFIILSRSRNWKMAKTLWITFLCGLGHVGSSVLLGFLGVALGWSLNSLEWFEGMRGNIAGWLIILFGLGYLVYGIKKAFDSKPHTHWHQHTNGTIHLHEHKHSQEHAHVHESETRNLTPWLLFVIFVFGPCEPLIPVLMYPAAKGNPAGLIAVVLVFSIATIATMMTVVYLSAFGLKRLSFGKLERFSHAIAGSIILLSGIGVQFLGL